MDKISKLSMLSLILVAVCVISRPVDADTSIYVFDPNKSTVNQTGGFAGVNITYAVIGQYRLAVDSDLSVASFEIVDANLIDKTGAEYGQDLNEIFNMTALAGSIINEMTIEFEGKTADGTESDVRLKLSLKNDTARLTGNTTPPPNTADMFLYDVNAVAVKKYTGGAGEPNDPYQIATAEDLMLLGETPADYDKHFILTADIDLDPNIPGRKVFDKAVIAPDMNDTEDGFKGTPFTGVFDGNGHTISRLTINGTSYLGLFGHIDTGAIISNLGLEEVDINGTGHFVGGLAGRNGRTHHQLSGHITNCYSKGIVRVKEGDVGGLVGFNTGWINTSLSIGTVSGSYRVGGLVGWNQGPVINSYSLCIVMGESEVGGFIGGNGHFALFGGPGEIYNCFSAGSVRGVLDVGGFVGSNSHGEVVNCLWDIETSSLINMCGSQSDNATGCDDSYGKTTAEMQTASTFLEAGWDFVGETENGTEDIWSICEKTNYPRFVWHIPVGDFVCPDGVTIEDFSFFMEHWLDGNCDPSNDYCEGTDLDQSGRVDAIDLEIFFENWPDKN